MTPILYRAGLFIAWPFVCALMLFMVLGLFILTWPILWFAEFKD